MVNKLSTFKAQEKRSATLFLVPSIVILLITSVFPLLYSLYLSMFKYNMLMPGVKPTFIGLKNYLDAFGNKEFLHALRLSLVYVFISVTIEFFIGFAVAFLVTAKIKALSVIRVSLLMPLMMTPVVAGILWRFIFNPEYGVLNYLRSLWGGDMIIWLATSRLAFRSIIIVEVWQQIPVVIFVLAAGIASLPEEVYEAADIDGSNWWQKFLHITLPLMRPVIAVILLLRIMDCFKIFDVIYTLTYGGPGKSTEVVGLFIYKEGLKFFQIGRATAMSWIFLVIVLAISALFMREVWKDPE